MPGVRTTLTATAAIAATLSLVGCGGDDAADRAQRFTAGGVDVSVELVSWDGRTGMLAATFEPEAGFHLYSASLPRGGIAGVGQRTAVVVRGALRSAGRPRVEARPRAFRVRGVARPLPVYPDGPVRLELPVRRAPGASARAAISYGACSAVSCQVPVVGRRVAVPLP